LGKRTLDKGRIEAISDGIYAIAMTLAVLSIDVDATLPTHQTLVSSLPDMLSALRHYIIAFLTLASFWIGQHYLMDRIKRTDAGLNWMIMLHLLFITLIPVTTDIISSFQSIIGVQIFVVNLFLISVSIDLEYMYVRKHPDLGIDEEISKHKFIGMLLFPGFSVFVFIMAWPLKEWATLLYMFLPFMRRRIN